LIEKSLITRQYTVAGSTEMNMSVENNTPRLD